MHLLCHYLNIKGYPAFICDYFPNRNSKSYINLDFITPLLTSDIVNDHKECNKNPIVVYPEIISGNPLNADCVVRYLLNYPGLIGGEKDEKYGNCDLIFSYSELIKESLVKFESEIMFMPVCDTNVFYEKSNRKIRRQGSCFYANKYQYHHNGKLFDITNRIIQSKNFKVKSNNKCIELADLNYGLYFIEIQLESKKSSNQNQIFKLIINQ